ncbi:hypothetical protein EXIGLDRAFT_730780 [Exidia glandulosa HHB12029]|uniref:ABM domain-containing protein n=1 Tax=Exidia glandulosa HHB12029 TaxID=1314781 RepID=A0A165C245_EXIGL|nr:hypothetical protein EXIGLDRAFT_730780 [Exidia glandulosa HHB12029]
MPVFEYCAFDASQGYKLDPSSAVRPVVEIMLEHASGMLSYHHGLQVDDKSKGYFFVGWRSLADHQRLIDDQNIYPKLSAAVEACVAPGGTIAMQHFDFTCALDRVTNVTEFGLYTLAAGGTKRELQKVWDTEIVPILRNSVAEEGLGIGVDEGPSPRPNANAVLMPLGWSSEEERQDFKLMKWPVVQNALRDLAVFNAEVCVHLIREI